MTAAIGQRVSYRVRRVPARSVSCGKGLPFGTTLGEHYAVGGGTLVEIDGRDRLRPMFTVLDGAGAPVTFDGVGLYAHEIVPVTP